MNVLQGGLTHSFSYDSVDRMIGSTLSTTPSVNVTYTLDGVGNRTTVTGGDNPGNYTMSAANPPADANMNQYTTTPMGSRTYDNNGNLLTRTGTNPPAGTFAYDYKNRMVRFVESVSGKRHDYVYDCLGRLIRTVVDVGGPTESQTLYYYKGHQIVEERDGTDTVQATYVYGNYIDEVITMRRLNTDYYYVRDDQYNVVRIEDASGSIVESYDYDDFGAPLNPTTRQVLTSSAVGNPFFFTGRAFDCRRKGDILVLRQSRMSPLVLRPRVSQCRVQGTFPIPCGGNRVQERRGAPWEFARKNCGRNTLRLVRLRPADALERGLVP